MLSVVFQASAFDCRFEGSKRRPSSQGSRRIQNSQTTTEVGGLSRAQGEGRRSLEGACSPKAGSKAARIDNQDKPADQHWPIQPLEHSVCREKDFVSAWLAQFLGVSTEFIVRVHDLGLEWSMELDPRLQCGHEDEMSDSEEYSMVSTCYGALGMEASVSDMSPLSPRSRMDSWLAEGKCSRHVTSAVVASTRLPDTEGPCQVSGRPVMYIASQAACTNLKSCLRSARAVAGTCNRARVTHRVCLCVCCLILVSGSLPVLAPTTRHPQLLHCPGVEPIPFPGPLQQCRDECSFCGRPCCVSGHDRHKSNRVT